MASYLFLALVASAVFDIGLSFPHADSNNRRRLVRGAIASNGVGCADHAKDVIEDGGSAADAGITLLLCEGVILPQAAGIGGGFIGTYFDKESGEVVVLNAREWAPAASNETMFVDSAVSGGMAVAVPGEIKGYQELHKKYGKLPWARLFQPIIKMCRDGHPVMKIVADVMKKMEDIIQGEPTMKDFINPATNRVWEENDIMTRPELANTLERIATVGADDFYSGEIASQIVADVQEKGGILTEDDMKEYRVNWSEPTKTTFLNDYTVYSIPTPGSGAVITMILNMMENAGNLAPNDFWHRTVESIKHAYGLRTNLADMAFEESVEEVFYKMLSKEYAQEVSAKIDPDSTSQDYSDYGATFADPVAHGTLNSVVYHPNGDALAFTSTVNTNFGAKFCSKKTGILMNDEMDDFSTPGKNNAYGFAPSPANFIKPKKRPQSSMCPTIILNKSGNVELAIGGAGGSKITSSVAITILRYLLLKENIYDAVNLKRLHHQLAPMNLYYEPGFDQSVIDSLAAKGHNMTLEDLSHGFNAVTAVATRYRVFPVMDSRRGGSTAVIY